MKRLFIFIFFLMMTFHATADEVGNTTFVTEPKLSHCLPPKVVLAIGAVTDS